MEAEKKDERDRQLQEVQCSNEDVESDEHRRIKETCVREIISCQEEIYQQVAADSVQNSFDALLLPSIIECTPANTSDVEEIADVVHSEVNQVKSVNSIQLEKEKTRKALIQAQYYRNLAERLRKEKRDEVCNMNDKVELVRGIKF